MLSELLKPIAVNSVLTEWGFLQPGTSKSQLKKFKEVIHYQLTGKIISKDRS